MAGPHVLPGPCACVGALAPIYKEKCHGTGQVWSVVKEYFTDTCRLLKCSFLWMCDRSLFYVYFFAHLPSFVVQVFGVVWLWTSGGYFSGAACPLL